MAENEYFDLLAPKAAPAVEGNEYSSIIDEQESNRQKTLRSNIVGAQDTNADKFAETLSLSEKTKLPPDTVERNQDEVKREQTANEYMDLLGSAPVAQRFYADPNNAKIAHDDVTALTMVEGAWNTHRAFASEIVDFGGKVLRGAGETYGVVDRGLRNGTYAALKAVGADDVIKILSTPIPDLLNPAGMLSLPGDAIKDAAEAIAPPKEDQNITTDIAGALGQVTAQITASILTGGAGSITSLISLFTQGVDQQAQMQRRAGEHGTPGADTALIAGGAVTAVTEKIGLDMLMKYIPEGIRGRILKMVAGASSEAIQEVTEGVMHNLTAVALYDPDQPIFEGVEKDATVAGATGAIVSMILPGRQAQSVMEMRDRVDHAQQKLAASNLAKRDPSRAAAFNAEVMKEDGVEEVYIPVDKLIEYAEASDDPSKVYEAMGVADQVEEAKLLGGDVRITTQAFGEHVLLSKDYEQLKDHIRYTEDGMTAAEAKEFKKTGLDKEADEVSRETTAPEGDVQADLTPEQVQTLADAGFEAADIAALTPAEANDLIGDEPLSPVQESAKLVVARRMPDGSVRYGEPGDLHSDLIDVVKETDGALKGAAVPSGDMGFALPGGEFMPRAEAAEWVKANEPERAPPARKSGRERTSLEASKYNQAREQANAAVGVAEQEMGLQGLFRTAAEAGLAPEKYKAYLVALQRASEAGRRAQELRVLRQELRSTTEAWQTEEATVRSEVTEGVKNEPVYAALDAIGRERLDRGIIMDVLLNDESQLSKLPKQDHGRVIFTNKGEAGVDPDLHAQQHGFEDAAEMVTAMMDAKPASELIDQRTQQEMLKRHGDIHQRQEALKTSIASLHNNSQAAVLTFELNQLREAVGQKRVSAAMLRAAAKERLQGHRIQDISVAKFLAAERRYAKEAARLLRGSPERAAMPERIAKNGRTLKATEAQPSRVGDRAAAAQAKFRQLLNFQFAREAEVAATTTMRRADTLRKMANPRKKRAGLDADYVDKIIEMLAPHDFARQRSDETHYTNMTQAEFNAVYEGAKYLEKQGRAEKQFMLKGKALELDFTVAELVDKASALPTLKRTTAERADVTGKRSMLWGIEAHANKVEFMIRRLDGAIGGPWLRSVFQPFADAQDAKAKLLAAKVKPVIDALEKLPSNTVFKRKTTTPGGTGQAMTHLSRLMLALNVGNESNYTKTQKGHDWSPAQIDSELAQLTAEDLHWVQSVWSAFDAIYPQVEQIYRNKFGISPERIQPRQVTINGVTLNGGYLPMMYDHRSTASSDPRLDPTTVDARGVSIGDHVEASVFSGMTKSRTSYTAPVLLDVSRLPEALENVAHYVTHFETVAEAKKLLRQKEIRNVIADKLGMEANDTLAGWVDALATSGRSTSDIRSIEGASDAIRGNIAAAFLGASYTTLVAQSLGLTSAVATLGRKPNGDFSSATGAKWLGVGMKIYLSNHKASVAEAISLSKELSTRTESALADVSDKLKRLEGKAGILTTARRATLRFIGTAQLTMVDYPTWIGGYNQALAAGETSDAAAEYADAILRQSQGSGHLKDLTALQRQKGLMRLATMFSTYTAVQYNQLRSIGQDVKTRPIKNLPGAVGGLMWAVVIPAILDGMLRSELPDDEEDSLLAWSATKSLAYAVGAIPIIGSPIASAVKGFNPNLLTADSIGERGARFAKALWKAADDDFLDDEEKNAKALKATVEFIGLAAGIPGTAQFSRIYSALEAGEDADWYEFLVGHQKKK